MTTTNEAITNGATHQFGKLYLKFDGYHWFILEFSFCFVWSPFDDIHSANFLMENAARLRGNAKRQTIETK